MLCLPEREADLATGTKLNDSANAMASKMFAGGVTVSAARVFTVPSEKHLRRSAGGGLAMMGNGDVAQVSVARNIGVTGAGHIDAGIIKQPCSLFSARRAFMPFEARLGLSLTDKAE